MPEEPDNDDDDLTEKLVGVALKDGTKVAVELVKPKILGFEDEENPLRYGTVRSVKLLKPDEGSGDPMDETEDPVIDDNDDDSKTPENPLRYATVRDVKLLKPTDEGSEENPMDERLENLVIENIPSAFDLVTIGEMRELLKQLPPQVRKGRRTSGYNIYLGKCLVGGRESDIPASEHIRECNLSWRDLPEAKKGTYRELAREANEDN